MSPGGRGGRLHATRPVVVGAALLGLLALAAVVVTILGGGDDADPPDPTSREGIRAALLQIPTGDPAEVTAYLDSDGGATLRRMTDTAHAVLDAEPAQVCPVVADAPDPTSMLGAAAAVPDEALADGYGALRSALYRISRSCADSGQPGQDAVDRLALVMMGITERLSQIGVEE